VPVIIERTGGLVVERLLAAGASHSVLRCPAAVGRFGREIRSGVTATSWPTISGPMGIDCGG
jgi:hypothetical protein